MFQNDLKEKVVNGVSTTEHENVKREIPESKKNLESALKANVTLTNQVKEISNVYSRCDAEKESLKDEIAALVGERLSFQAENKKLK